MDLVYKLLTSAVYEVPVIAVLSVGVVLAMVNRRKMPKASMFAIFGFSLLLLKSLVGIARLTWIILFSAENTLQTIDAVSVGTGILAIVFASSGIALLTAAIFVERKGSNLKDN